MKQEKIQLVIVLAVAFAAVIGLVSLMNFDAGFDFTPAITGGAVMQIDSTQVSEQTQVIVTSASSAGCCNWDCEHYRWICRTRDMQCSLGKPAITCRE
jgi:hypothetical protein